ncbi:DUF169 domain-containing protein [bacterium]|nr:DUF169 domain-containing protein [candidate division CSSED10-310 bacterium]
MQKQVIDTFLALWRKYFKNADLPIGFFYTDELPEGMAKPVASDMHCLIGSLKDIRNGKDRAFDEPSILCGGGKRYTGFTDTLMPKFEYFLSCGIPGILEGERYKKSPEMVKQIMSKMDDFKSPGKYLVFRRIDHFTEDETPNVIIFFAQPDVLSGMFTLSAFDEEDFYYVGAPFSAGCGSIILYPYLESLKPNPRCILGMFDVSARPFVEPDVLTFSIPLSKFFRMVDNIPESFLITTSWQKVMNRLP